MGTGYVYSGAFRTAEEAESEVRAHLGPMSDGCPANPIKMRIGKNLRTWVNNCLSVGLAAGFLTDDFEECRDFLNIHYCLSEREDSPFWQAARRVERPDRAEAEGLVASSSA